MVSVANNLKLLLGDNGWIVGENALGYERDWLNRYGVKPIGVARPTTVDQVSSIIKTCADAGVLIVPQGGNTGLCGGAVVADGRGVILSLSRMNSIGTPDPATGAVECEAGAVLSALHNLLDDHDLMFPLHLGAEGTAQIGGLISTNAGGSHALRYGMMQDLVLGLEVVLPDGRIWNGLRSVQKDNAGYQLRKLFCGAEGTLGVVTKAVLKVYPKPKQTVTALLALKNVATLVDFGIRLRAELGEHLNGLEFFHNLGLDFALKNIEHLNYPLNERATWYLLVELTSGSPKIPLENILQELLEQWVQDGTLIDGTIAMSEAQRAAFWRLREEQPEGQRKEGYQLKHDISVPPGRLAYFIENANTLCEDILAGVRINPFGHLGDGNIHYNLSPPVDHADFGDLAEVIALRLGKLATSLGGSFAAEHGLGSSKVGLADALRSSVERELMGVIKKAIDPTETMNPGVICSGSRSTVRSQK